MHNFALEITHVLLPGGSRVFLLDRVLPPEFLDQVHRFLSGWHQKNPEWLQILGDHGLPRPRWEYQGDHPTWQALRRYFASDEMIGTINRKMLIGRRVNMMHMVLYLDGPGIGPLAPHYEADGSYLAQIYFTTTAHPWSGTTIYNSRGDILIQLPWRDNFGWFFDEGPTVNHGRHHDVPQGIQRFSLMVWYADLVRQGLIKDRTRDHHDG